LNTVLPENLIPVAYGNSISPIKRRTYAGFLLSPAMPVKKSCSTFHAWFNDAEREITRKDREEEHNLWQYSNRESHLL
jgi:hypothetical protein